MTQPARPGTRPAPAPAAPVTGATPGGPRPVSVADSVDEMRTWFSQLERAVSAYNALNDAFLTATGQLPEGTRARGLPVFEFPATLNGRDSVKCALDLKKIPADQLPTVLPPLIVVAAGEVIESLNEIGAGVDVLSDHLKRVFAAPAG
jgi:hypothetical protein